MKDGVQEIKEELAALLRRSAAGDEAVPRPPKPTDPFYFRRPSERASLNLPAKLLVVVPAAITHVLPTSTLSPHRRGTVTWAITRCP